MSYLEKEPGSLDAQPPLNGSARAPGGGIPSRCTAPVWRAQSMGAICDRYFDNAARARILTVVGWAHPSISRQRHRERVRAARQLYEDGRISTQEGHKDPSRTHVQRLDARLLG